MLPFSTNMQSVLNLGHIEGFYLLRVVDSTGVVIFSSTTHYTDITLSNGNTYFSDGKIIAVDAPQLSSTVDREQYKIVLTDPSFALSSKLDSNLVGKQLETRIGFVDSNNSISNANYGKPYTNVEDTFVIYRGLIEAAAYEIDTNTIGESKIAISGASPLLSLDQKNGIYLSKDYIHKNSPTDTSCDQIYQGSLGLVLKWGRT